MKITITALSLKIDLKITRFRDEWVPSTESNIKSRRVRVNRKRNFDLLIKETISIMPEFISAYIHEL